MKILYKNFDKLEVAFQGAFPEETLEILRQARDQAKLHNNVEVLAEIGRSQKIVKVSATGARGGYAYRFDTGPDGAVWFVIHSTRTDRWNRDSAQSFYSRHCCQFS
jgi:hypothetical protein